VLSRPVAGSWKRRRQSTDVADDDIAATPEQRRKIGLRACVDRDAEHRNAQQSRSPHGLAGVLDRKAAFMMIDIVGLSIGQHQQELLALRLVDELGRGSFGTNSNGLDDLAGNVWEWTNSCFACVSLDGERERITKINCGVRVVEGAHRSYMTDFIRDPRSGGCAAGVPPANLGFRLVVEPSQSVAMSAVRSVTKLLRRT
jgi:hypothetical protein